VARPAVKCASAADADFEQTQFDIALFDPPYFDYIAYSELSEFYRVWWPQGALGGTPLLATGNSPITQFATLFGKCLRNTLIRLRAGGLVVFTFHAASRDAWTAVGLALDDASLSITSLWPVLTDPHMGHHSYEGNCEWDIVIVARRKSECAPSAVSFASSDWIGSLRPLKVRASDRLSMMHAIEMATPRFATLARG
jgi:adenine-specific DNA methylase